MKYLNRRLLFTAWAVSIAATPDAVVQEADEGYRIRDEEEYLFQMRPLLPTDARFTAQGQLARSLIGVRYRSRGEENSRTRYEVNGAELIDAADARPYWNIISALNTMIRTPTDAPPLTIGPGGLSPSGGTHSLLTAGSALREQSRVTYALTNRNYRHRITAATRREFPGGWALSAAANYRAGRDNYVQGLFTDLLSGSFSLSKALGTASSMENGSARHLLTFTGAGITGEQGVRGAATQEAYDLAGSNYYNPHWGYQRGALRNSRVRAYDQWFGALTYSGSFAGRWEAAAALSGFGGRNSYSMLSWYDAPTPYADYYRYMPSFFADPAVAASAADEWRAGNPTATQIDWARLYESSRIASTEDGTLRAHYIVRDLVTDKLNLALSGSLAFYPERSRSGTSASSAPAGSETALRIGFRAKADRADNFARLKDLLGADWWLDIDQFLVDDEYYGDKLQNNMRNPDRRIRRGERFGYDYRIARRSVGLWVAAQYKGRRCDLAAGAEAGRVDFLRSGRYEKEMFPGYQSYGPSARVAFTEYAASVNASFWPSLRHLFTLRASAAGHAPTVRGLFVAPQYRNETVPEALARAAGGGAGTSAPTATISNGPLVRVLSGEVAWRWQPPGEVTVNAAAWATQVRGETDVRGFYDDIGSEYTNLILSDVGRMLAGVEASVEVALTGRLALTAATALSSFRYADNPKVTLLRDSDGAALLTGAESQLDGLHTAVGPERAALLMISYRTYPSWRFEATLRWLSGAYAAPDPARRLTRALDAAGSPETRRAMMAQEAFAEAVLPGVSVSKWFNLPGGRSIGLWLMADNLLDNRTIRTSGYEQMRLRRTSDGAGRTYTPFPSKYYYAHGANYYLMITCSF